VAKKNIIAQNQKCFWFSFRGGSVISLSSGMVNGSMVDQ
jgi:hypothetical protein